MSEQGSKSGRRERHLAYQRDLKVRKRLRRERAAVHGAMDEAEAMRKVAKKGPSQFDRFMRELGYEPRQGHGGTKSGREIAGTDVLDKYERVV